ncbi:hypothetical protein PRIPAC_78186 [Pristionchus pacificus]|nr:hypothetical protein PRIPAC_78186 [Pristionchus pacificus]
MPVKCLVCGKQTSVTHMGMDACRACTVFYRRNRTKRLLCVKGYRGCMNHPKHAFACRKCRLERFKAILKAGADDDKTLYASALSIFRRIAELNLRGIRLDVTEPYDERLEIIPSTYQYTNEGKKIQIAGLFKYIPAMFPEFRVLPNADKWLLIRNYNRIFHCIDSALRVLRMFGKDSFNYFFGSYTTIVSNESIMNFFVDCPDQTNASTAARTIFGTFRNIVDPIRSQIRQFDPSEDEFMALMGLAFWSFARSCSRSLSAIEHPSLPSCPRTIAAEFQRIEMLLQSDYDVFHLLGAFDDETVTYKLGIR